MKCDVNPLTPGRRPATVMWRRLLLWGLVPALFCACAQTRAGRVDSRLAPACSFRPWTAEEFDFSRDTFAFANQLTWVYSFDANGHWAAHARKPKPTYALHCFVLVRSAEQFFRFVRFDPMQPKADEATYRALVRRVVSINPRKHWPECERIVVPGFADLRDFSAAHEELLKRECGGAVQCYFQRGNWRMVFPFSRREQEKMARQLAEAVRRDGTAIAHLARFPDLSINHVFLLFEAHETNQGIEFHAYDPNNPSAPAILRFERKTRTFLLPRTNYFSGGKVDVYQIYHAWDY